MPDTLLPCPLCGVDLVRRGDYTHEDAWNWWQHPEGSDCLLAELHVRESFYETHDDIKKWNTRHVTALPADGLAGRPCTCHPDDNPPVPCPRKYALTECRAAAALPAREGWQPRLGEKVRVKQDPDHPWTADWRNEYFVCGMNARENGSINIWLSDRWPIQSRGDATDDFDLRFIEPLTAAHDHPDNED